MYKRHDPFVHGIKNDESLVYFSPRMSAKLSLNLQVVLPIYCMEHAPQVMTYHITFITVEKKFNFVCPVINRGTDFGTTQHVGTT